MYSLRKWFAAKMFAQQAVLNSENNQRNGNFSRLFGNSFNQANGNNQDFLHRQDTLLQFYYADEELNMVASELDSFDGRRDPVRCTNLVNQLRSAQDKLITILFRLMDEWNCERTSRDYRIKFPDDLLAGNENGESLNGQIWFGAECLAAGSNIMNHESESDALRPIAKTLTVKLDQLRLELRHCCADIDDNFMIYKDRIGLDLMFKLQQFDRIFANFEYEYVKAMLPIKTVKEIEQQQDLMVLFSESVQSALKRGLISQDEFDECEPTVIINIPRLAIIHGLVRCGQESPILKRDKSQLSSVFKPFHSRLHRIHSLLQFLRPVEIEILEKILINKDSELSAMDSFSWLKGVNLIGDHLSQRRYSDPGIVDQASGWLAGNGEDDEEDDGEDNYENSRKDSFVERPLKKCFSSISLMYILTKPDSKECGNYSANDRQLCDDNDSLASNATTTTNSTVDSFEIALAIGAKHSKYVSPGSKELLHNLFVSVAGIADQLQTNYASELRTILQNVYNLHSSSSDDNDEDLGSVEEALEAQEDSEDATSASSSNATSPSEAANITFPGSSYVNSNSVNQFNSAGGVCGASESGNTNNNHHHQQSTHNQIHPSSTSAETSNILNNTNQRETTRRLLPPIWVPDEMVSACILCDSQFTLIRRRHHCRNCGNIYCNSCCNYFVPLAHYGFPKPVRVCTICYYGDLRDIGIQQPLQIS
ncbi:lateral signaling target protein 2 homolog [Tetranychus urticae]|uniref:FYVE-type domain-containing protein n=1 Tax=Tetranychus urticae TaxID=32264 RepID=T1JV27_TETUR|nr:lateral signaling target protein 2 homolog [Tetranychus urticae]